MSTSMYIYTCIYNASIRQGEAHMMGFGRDDESAAAAQSGSYWSSYWRFAKERRAAYIRNNQPLQRHWLVTNASHTCEWVWRFVQAILRVTDWLTRKIACSHLHLHLQLHLHLHLHLHLLLNTIWTQIKWPSCTYLDVLSWISAVFSWISAVWALISIIYLSTKTCTQKGRFSWTDRV